ncbi:MAG: beta-lactamase family protein [Myxococcales bacterium]|nr:beta-lactamase family protein [Myxococcales bacterium]
MRRTCSTILLLAALAGCGTGSSRGDSGSLDSLGPTSPTSGSGTEDDAGDDSGDTTLADAEDGGTTAADDGSQVDFDPAFALAQVDAALAAGVPGLAIAIVYDGEVVLAEGFGVADEGGTAVDATTLFNLASVTKVVTALTVLSERDAGLVSLDTPVPQVVPQFVLRDGFDANAVQIRHLLTHSAGLGDWPTEPYVYGNTLLEEFAANPNQPLWFPPGAVFDYSNRGYTLAGLVAATLHGGSFADAAQARVLAPFGMDGATLDAAIAGTRTHARGESSWDGGWVGPADYVGESYQPSAGLWAGADDLGGFVRAFATASAPGFAAGTIAEAESPIQPTHEGPGAYGYGLFVDGGEPAVVYHGGSTGGYLADLEVVPSLGFGVAIVVNTDAWDPSQAGWAILAHYAGSGTYPQDPDPIDPASFPGSYDDPWQLGRIDVTATDTGLSASFADFGTTVALEPLWGASFSCAHPVTGDPIDLMFWPDADGQAVYLVSRAGVAARM